jgi:hypothetical protein
MSSKTITAHYLQSILENKIYSVKRNEISMNATTYKKIKKLDLYMMVSAILENKKLNLGFDIYKIPNKQWLLDILQHLDPKNSLFSFKEDTNEIPIQFPVEKFKFYIIYIHNIISFFTIIIKLL